MPGEETARAGGEDEAGSPEPRNGRRRSARAEGGDAKEAREARVAVTLESSGAAAQVDKRVVVRRATTLTWA